MQKAFDIYIIKIALSFDSTVSQVIQNSSHSSNRKLEGSKTIISPHICLMTGVKAVAIRKRNFH